MTLTKDKTIKKKQNQHHLVILLYHQEEKKHHLVNSDLSTSMFIVDYFLQMLLKTHFITTLSYIVGGKL